MPYQWPISGLSAETSANNKPMLAKTSFCLTPGDDNSAQAASGTHKTPTSEVDDADCVLVLANIALGIIPFVAFCTEVVLLARVKLCNQCHQLQAIFSSSTAQAGSPHKRHAASPHKRPYTVHHCVLWDVHTHTAQAAC